MRSRHADERRENTDRNQNVPRSLLSSRSSIGISRWSPLAASSSAVASERFTASAKSQNVGNDEAAAGSAGDGRATFATLAGVTSTRVSATTGAAAFDAAASP